MIKYYLAKTLKNPIYVRKQRVQLLCSRSKKF